MAKKSFIFKEILIYKSNEPNKTLKEFMQSYNNVNIYLFMTIVN
jgi:hypothetical protein